MEYRLLGRSGLKVSTLTMGTMTFGGKDPSSARSAPPVSTRRAGMIDLCIDAGVNLIDTANVYSRRRLGGDHRRSARRQAQGRRADRDQGALSPMGERPNDEASRAII